MLDLTGKYVRLAVIGGLVIVLDQLTKALVVQHLVLNETLSVLPGFFDLTHIHNPGGAFGFMASVGSTLRKIVFLFFSSLAVGFIFYLYNKTPRSHPWLASGFALIFGGAIGNLIDRIRLGIVIDFLDVYVGRWHWPAFNIADSAITVGIGIFIFHLLFKKMPS